MKMSKSRIQSDILEWSLPKEVLAVLLKDYTTVDFVFPNCHTLCDKLSWSHYRLLAAVDKIEARDFYLSEAVKCKWSVRDLQRQIETQLYKHYYEREMMNPGDNPPIGIVLGSDRDEAVIRYTLNEHERNLFAVKYHLNLPTVEELQMELMRERAAIEEAMALRALPPPGPKKKSAPRRTSKGDK